MGERNTRGTKGTRRNSNWRFFCSSCASCVLFLCFLCSVPDLLCKALPLLLVENRCGGYRLAIGVSSFGSLRHRLAVSGNDVLTRNMVLSTSLLNVKARLIRIDSLNGKKVEC